MYYESYVGPVHGGHTRFHIFGSDVVLITTNELKMYVQSRSGHFLWLSINRRYCRRFLCKFCFIVF